MFNLRILVLFFLGIGGGAWSQIVTIPDVQFKNALLFKDVVDIDEDGIPDRSADFNSDGEIQTSEALQIERLYVRAEAIESLEGIEAFTNLIILSCNQNSLTALDFSQNLQLRELNCFFNNLTSLNVSQNSALEIINCEFNDLVDLDLSGNPNLERLWCTHNLFSEIDVTQNQALKNLNVSSNQLSSLNVSENELLEKLYFNNNDLSTIDLVENPLLSYLDCSNNVIQNLDVSYLENLNYLVCKGNQLETLNFQTGSNLNVQYFNAEENPGLGCIQVDDAEFSEGQSFWRKDETTIFSENCLLGVSENDEATWIVYPNPAKEVLYFSGNEDLISLMLVDAAGRILLERNTAESLDISMLPEGFYTLGFKTSKGVFFKNFVKQ